MVKIVWLTAVTTMGAVLLANGYHGLAEATMPSAATTAPLPAFQTRAAPHQPTRLVWAGVYTKEQATRGQQAYQQLCSRCHRDDLSGSEAVPQLAGSSFLDRWNDSTLLDIFAWIQSAMPHDYKVFVSANSARDIIAFLLQENAIPAGKEELPKDIDGLADIRITGAPSH